MKFRYLIISTVLALSLFECHSKPDRAPVIGFVDAFEDATVAQARDGFTRALADKGFSEARRSVHIDYRNAQGSIPSIVQIVNYFIGRPVNALATCTTLATLTALQKTSVIPVFAMVSPTPARMKVLTNGRPPANLFGVVEDLAYIDTSFSLIRALLKTDRKLTVGLIYNQSEPQSADALGIIQANAGKSNINVIALPVNSSAETQLVTRALLAKNIDAFFALPDNTVFASFETIVKSCNERAVPIFTSEAGLVKRGAAAAFGADMYQWGYQAGLQAAVYLKNGKTSGLKPEMVQVRRRVYNPAVAARYHLIIPANFKAVK